jgi:hypothetical protein
MRLEFVDDGEQNFVLPVVITLAHHDDSHRDYQKLSPTLLFL